MPTIRDEDNDNNEDDDDGDGALPGIPSRRFLPQISVTSAHESESEK